MQSEDQVDLHEVGNSFSGSEVMPLTSANQVPTVTARSRPEDKGHHISSSILPRDTYCKWTVLGVMCQECCIHKVNTELSPTLERLPDLCIQSLSHYLPFRANYSQWKCYIQAGIQKGDKARSASVNINNECYSCTFPIFISSLKRNSFI